MAKRMALIAARSAARLSQAQVAEKVDVILNTYGRWERGESTPYPVHIRRLMALFGKSAQELDLAPDPQEEHLEEPTNITAIADGIAAANVLAYEHIARNDLRRVMRIVDSYDLLLQPLLASSSQLEAAATLMSRVYQLRQSAAYHFVGATGSIDPAKAAVKYARLAGDRGLIDLNNALRQHSSSYEWPADGMPLKKRREIGLALSAEAAQLCEKYSDRIPAEHQARTHTGHAKFLALTGQRDLALTELGKMHDALDKYDGSIDEQYIATDYIAGSANHVRQEAIVFSYLSNQIKAVELFMSLLSTSGDRIGPREPLPNRMYASMISETIISWLRLPNAKKDKELTIALWQAAFAAAQELRSATYINESRLSLNIMECVWPDDSRITELHDILDS